MWLKPMPKQVLSALPILLSTTLSISLRVLMVIVGLFLPLIDLSLIRMLLLKKLVLSKQGSIAHYLGLNQTACKYDVRV